MDFHDHGFFQIIYVLEDILLADYGSGWNEITEGTAHILPTGFTHSLRSPKGHFQLGINFNTTDDERGFIRRLANTFKEPGQTTIALPARLHQYLMSPQIIPDEMTQMEIINLFDEFCLSLLNQNTDSKEETLKHKMLEFLKKHRNHNIMVEDIAEAMKMSRASLQRFCKKSFNCGVHNLHERIRIEHAVQLMQQKKITISQCAAKCGYTDIYAFSRAFKRAKGSSPSIYMKRFPA